MYLPVQIKICGITNSSDLSQALSLGADYIGLNVYAGSPRRVGLEDVGRLLEQIPEGKRVLVDVSTPTEELERYARELSFDYFQIHFEPEVSLATVSAWAGLVGQERLWLAPRVPPGEPFPELALEFADTLLIDGYHPDQFGGTGKTGDWSAFAQLQERFPTKTWILAGGLTPDNVKEALSQSFAQVVDVCSGVEAQPGLKDEVMLRAFFDQAQGD
ncbi:MAG: phosphoribosylanthranilate isomerase [Opitutales bacterium]